MAIEFAGLLPALQSFDWRPEHVRREIAVIAYHFHWSRAECMGLSRRERAAWIEEIKRINKEIAKAMKGKSK
ncbi:MAG: DUF6760 family protein [Planctomycetota bacterium]